LSLNKIHDFFSLQDNADNQFEVKVTIEPPKETSEAAIDHDRDSSDDEVMCNPEHLQRRILLANVLNESVNDSQLKIVSNPTSTSTSHGLKHQKRVIYTWHADKSKIENIVTDFSNASEEQLVNATETNPLEIFEE
jgi:hypothetical protein